VGFEIYGVVVDDTHGAYTPTTLLVKVI